MKSIIIQCPGAGGIALARPFSWTTLAGGAWPTIESCLFVMAVNRRLTAGNPQYPQSAFSARLDAALALVGALFAYFHGDPDIEFNVFLLLRQ